MALSTTSLWWARMAFQLFTTCVGRFTYCASGTRDAAGGIWDTRAQFDRGIAMSRPSPAKRWAVLGAGAGVLACVIVFLWAYFVFDVRLTTEQARVTIPGGLVGERFDRARAKLTALGLTDVRTPGAYYYAHRASKVGDVIPAPGTEVNDDSTVSLIPKL